MGKKTAQPQFTGFFQFKKSLIKQSEKLFKNLSKNAKNNLSFSFWV